MVTNNKKSNDELHAENLTAYGAWHRLDQARNSFVCGDLSAAAGLLHNAVQAAGVLNDNRLLIEATILWRECRLRSNDSEFGHDCYRLAQQARLRSANTAV